MADQPDAPEERVRPVLLRLRRNNQGFVLPRVINNDRPVARNQAAEDERDLAHVAAIAAGTGSDGTRVELYAAVVAAAQEGVLPMVTETVALDVPEVNDLFTRHQNIAGTVFVQIRSTRAFRVAVREALARAIERARARHPAPPGARVVTRVWAMASFSCRVVVYQEGRVGAGDDAPTYDALMLVTERVQVRDVIAAATALSDTLHERLNVEIERYNPHRENVGQWNIAPDDPEAQLRLVVFISHGNLPLTPDEVRAEGAQHVGALFQQQNARGANIPIWDPVHEWRRNFVRAVGVVREQPARAARNRGLLGALREEERSAVASLMEGADARSRDLLVQVACGDGACALAAFAMSLACNLLAPPPACVARDQAHYTESSKKKTTRSMRRRRTLEALVHAHLARDPQECANRMRDAALNASNVLRSMYTMGSFQRMEADACHARLLTVPAASRMEVAQAFQLLASLPGAVVVYQLDAVAAYLRAAREHRTLPEPVFTANFEVANFVREYYDTSRTMHFFVLSETHVASAPALRTALFFSRRCRDCGPNVTHNVLPVRHEDCGNCERCNGYMRLTCLPRHRENCRGVQACETCGTSKGPFHKCHPRFAVKTGCEPYLYTPDAEFNFTPAMRAAAERALAERDSLRVVEAKHLPEHQDATLLTALAAQLRANRCTDPDAEAFRAELDALEERAVERFLPHVVAFDFETLSPHDAEKDVTAAGTVRTGVFPVVAHAEQVRAFPGQEKRTFTSIGLDCATKLVDWLGEFTRWVLELPCTREFMLRAFRREPPTADEVASFFQRVANQRGEGSFEEFPMGAYYSDAKMLEAAEAATARFERRRRHAESRGEQFEAPTEEEFAAMMEIERFAMALRDHSPWAVCLLGYNSSRFDSVFIAHKLPYDCVTRLKMRHGRVLNVTTGFVSHADLITFTGGSLDSAVRAFVPDASIHKIATPFDYFNSFSLKDVEAAPDLAEFRAPFPSADEWCVGRHARAEYEASYATLGPYRCANSNEWHPFKWFAHYCAVDVALLAEVTVSVVRNFTRSSGVVPLLRSITIASHALAANLGHHCFAEASAPKDLPPHAVSVVERSRSGGTVCVGATVATGEIYGDDAVSAYPSLCTNPKLVPVVLPFGAVRDDVAWLGNGRWGPTHTGSNDTREDVTRSLRGSLQRNPALERVLESINDPRSTLVGTYLVGVFVYPISPVTGQRVHLGPLRVRTKAGLVVQPVGVFYCHTALWPLRRAVAARFCEVLEVVEGFCFPETEGGDASPAAKCLREKGGCAYPATRDGLLNKWYTTGLPPTMQPPEVERFCGKLSEYFQREVRPESFKKNPQACKTYKLQVNCSWGANARGKTDELYVVTGPALGAVTSLLWAQRFGVPMSLNPVLQPDPREMAAIVNHVAMQHFDSEQERRAHAQQIAYTRSKQVIPVEPTTATRTPGSTMMPITRTPALATGLAVPDAMRHILFCVWQALTALGCTVIYSDTDSVKYVLPAGVTDRELQARMARAREQNEWFRELIKYTEWGNLPGNFCREIECQEAVVIRPKGAVFGGFVKSDTAELALAANPCGGCRACDACTATLAGLKRSIKLVMSGVNPGLEEPPTPELFLELLKNPGASFVDAVTTFKAVKTGGLPSGMQMNEGVKRYRASRTASEADEFGRITYDPPAALEPGLCVKTYPPFVTSKKTRGTRLDCARSEEYEFSTSLRDAASYCLPYESLDVGYQRLRRMEALARGGLLASEGGVGTAENPVVDLLSGSLPVLIDPNAVSPLFDPRLEEPDWCDEEMVLEGSDDELATATQAALERADGAARKRRAEELAEVDALLASQLRPDDEMLQDDELLGPPVAKRNRLAHAEEEEEEEDEEMWGLNAGELFEEDEWGDAGEGEGVEEEEEVF